MDIENIMRFVWEELVCYCELGICFLGVFEVFFVYIFSQQDCI